jgi:hypothetical protein
MNSSTLQKLEKGYIQLDWKEYINRVDLTKAHMETIIDIVDRDVFGRESIIRVEKC